MHATSLILGLLCGCLLMAAASQATAGDGTRKLLPAGKAVPAPTELRPDFIRPAAPRISPAEAARQVQHQYGGRVLSVQQQGSGYRVKVLKNGEVRMYIVEP
jgi:P pilus assembly chaperone PapD